MQASNGQPMDSNALAAAINAQAAKLQGMEAMLGVAQERLAGKADAQDIASIRYALR